MIVSPVLLGMQGAVAARPAIEVVPPLYALDNTFAGTSGDTSFVDATGRLWTAQGSAVLTATDPIIEPTSGSVPSPGSYWRTTDGMDALVLGENDFYIEGWFESSATALTLVDADSNAGGFLIYALDDSSIGWYSAIGPDVTHSYPGGVFIPDGTPVYFCVEREAGRLRAWLRTTLMISMDDVTNYSFTPAAMTFGWRIGSETRPFTGKAGMVRVDVGRCRWPGVTGDIEETTIVLPEPGAAPAPAP
jgi:hypothetical protein